MHLVNLFGCRKSQITSHRKTTHLLQPHISHISLQRKCHKFKVSIFAIWSFHILPQGSHPFWNSCYFGIPKYHPPPPPPPMIGKNCHLFPKILNWRLKYESIALSFPSKVLLNNVSELHFWCSFRNMPLDQALHTRLKIKYNQIWDML